MANKPVNFAPIDKHAADAKEATRLDLEAHARLEAGLVDSFLASDPVSATQPAPTVDHAYAFPMADDQPALSLILPGVLYGTPPRQQPPGS